MSCSCSVARQLVLVLLVLLLLLLYMSVLKSATFCHGLAGLRDPDYHLFQSQSNC